MAPADLVVVSRIAGLERGLVVAEEVVHEPEPGRQVVPLDDVLSRRGLGGREGARRLALGREEPVGVLEPEAGVDREPVLRDAVLDEQHRPRELVDPGDRRVVLGHGGRLAVEGLEVDAVEGVEVQARVPAVELVAGLEGVVGAGEVSLEVREGPVQRQPRPVLRGGVGEAGRARLVAGRQLDVVGLGDARLQEQREADVGEAHADVEERVGRDLRVVVGLIDREHVVLDPRAVGLDLGARVPVRLPVGLSRPQRVEAVVGVELIAQVHEARAQIRVLGLRSARRAAGLGHARLSRGREKPFLEEVRHVAVDPPVTPGRVEAQLVLDERAAELHGGVGEEVDASSGADPLVLQRLRDVVADELAVLEVVGEAAMEGVGAALGHEVVVDAGRADLGRVLGRRDVDLLEAVVVVVEAGRAGGGGVGDVHAVHGVRVLVPSAAVDREDGLESPLASAHVFAVHDDLGRHVLQDGPHVPRGGDPLEGVDVEVGRHARLRDVHERGAGHVHRLAEAAHIERGVDGERGREAHGEVASRELAEARQLEGQGVRPGREGGEAIGAFLVRRHRARRDEDGTGQGHRHPRRAGAGVVADLARDVAGLQGLGESDGGEGGHQQESCDPPH